MNDRMFKLWHVYAYMVAAFLVGLYIGTILG
jgi:hypothetical protein